MVPLSRLTSRHTWMLWPIMYPPLESRLLEVPSDCLVGLSRSLNDGPPAVPPPMDTVRSRISVPKCRVMLEMGLESAVIRTVRTAWLLKALKVAPPSNDTSPVQVEWAMQSALVPGAGGSIGSVAWAKSVLRTNTEGAKRTGATLARRVQVGLYPPAAARSDCLAAAARTARSPRRRCQT